MIANGGDTEGLFHGAFMQSGAAIPSGDVTLGQQDYDDLVRAAGCAGAEDTLECLRQVPFSALKGAVNMSPGFLSYRVCHNSPDPHERAQLRTLSHSRGALPGARGPMGYFSKPRFNSWFCGTTSPRFRSSQVTNAKFLCFPVDQPIRLPQAIVTMKELFSPYPASTLRE